MRSIWKVVAGLLVVSLALAATTLVTEARSPKLSKLLAEGTGATTFSVTGKATGLAGDPNLYEVRITGGTITANVDCINPGSQNVEAHATVSATVTGSTGPFSSGQNGNFNWSLTGTVSVPGEPCPNPNWTPVVTSYSGTFNLALFDFNGLSQLDAKNNNPVSFP